MKVISLFDGIACGLQALKQANIKVDEYHAFEIDKYTILIAKKNHPEIIHYGDVTDFDFSKFKNVDLLIGGSPCQSFSFAGKMNGMTTIDNIEITSLEQYLNLKQKGFKFKGESYLFWEYIRALREIKPKNFMLENVRMVKKWSDIITKELGVEPVLINSALVSAQNRQRNYWCNWKVTQPEDKGILLKDIVHENADSDSIMGNSWCKWFKENAEFQLSKKYSSLSAEKAITMTARQYSSWNGNFIHECLAKYIVPFDKTLQILDKEVEKGKIGYFNKGSQGDRVYYIHDKAITLTGHGGGIGAKTGLYLFGNISKRVEDISIGNDGSIRPHRLDARKSGISEIDTVRSINNDSKSNTLIASHHHYVHNINEKYLFGCITPDRVNKRQNGQRFSEGQKFYTLTAQDRHGILIEGYIRKLTPIECERLQTLPDSYSEGVSNSQRYKMLGNGWTVLVIEHLFKELMKENR